MSQNWNLDKIQAIPRLRMSFVSKSLFNLNLYVLVSQNLYLCMDYKSELILMNGLPLYRKYNCTGSTMVDSTVLPQVNEPRKPRSVFKRHIYFKKYMASVVHKNIAQLERFSGLMKDNAICHF